MKKLLTIGLLALSLNVLATEYVNVDSSIFIKQNEANELKFKKTMKGKPISGYGTVKSISETFGKTFVRLTNGYNLMIKRSHVDRAINLEKGESISFKGVVGSIGIFGDEVYIDDAEFNLR